MIEEKRGCCMFIVFVLSMYCFIAVYFVAVNIVKAYIMHNPITVDFFIKTLASASLWAWMGTNITIITAVIITILAYVVFAEEKETQGSR